jgi:predicted enzyme related to lactoylglutathione lyase
MAAKRKGKKAAAKKPVAKSKAKSSAKKAAARKPAARRAAPRSATKAAKKAAAPSVVHWEVQAKDPGRQQQFFSELFGWRIDADNPMGYGMVASGGKDAINGGIGTTDTEPRVTVYVQVDDIDALLSRAEMLGARTVLPRTDMGMVIMGQFVDPEGNIIGLVEG